MGLRRHYGVPLALLLMLGGGHALAQSEDTLKLKIESSLRYDNNLFRLPADANLIALLGTASAAERIDITSLSLNFSTTLSLLRSADQGQPTWRCSRPQWSGSVDWSGLIARLPR